MIIYLELTMELVLYVFGLTFFFFVLINFFFYILRIWFLYRVLNIDLTFDVVQWEIQMLKNQIDSVIRLTKLGFRWFAFNHFKSKRWSQGFVVIRIFRHEERSDFICDIWAKSLGNCSFIIFVHRDPKFFKFAHIAVFHSS